MEKYRARKLLRGLLSFPVHMEMHCVLATVLDQNLSFRNSLSCVLGKGDGCVVYLCVVGMGGGEDVRGSHLDALWNHISSLASQTVTRTELGHWAADLGLESLQVS